MPKTEGGENTAEIIIIGGGIMGICTAYFLAKQGAKGIVLLEKDYLAEASTGLSVGGFRQQFSHPANILLSQESIPTVPFVPQEPLAFSVVGFLDL